AEGRGQERGAPEPGLPVRPPGHRRARGRRVPLRGHPRSRGSRDVADRLTVLQYTANAVPWRERMRAAEPRKHATRKSRRKPKAQASPEPALLLRLYREMVRLRTLDERMMTLQRQGRVGFYGACTGQEAATLASAIALEANDWIFPALREEIG